MNEIQYYCAHKNEKNTTALIHKNLGMGRIGFNSTYKYKTIILLIVSIFNNGKYVMLITLFA